MLGGEHQRPCVMQSPCRLWKGIIRAASCAVVCVASCADDPSQECDLANACALNRVCLVSEVDIDAAITALSAVDSARFDSSGISSKLAAVSGWKEPSEWHHAGKGSCFIFVAMSSRPCCWLPEHCLLSSSPLTAQPVRPFPAAISTSLRRQTASNPPRTLWTAWTTQQPWQTSTISGMVKR